VHAIHDAPVEAEYHRIPRVDLAEVVGMLDEGRTVGWCV
jgi:hypothetical protein